MNDVSEVAKRVASALVCEFCEAWVQRDRSRLWTKTCLSCAWTAGDHSIEHPHTRVWTHVPCPSFKRRPDE